MVKNRAPLLLYIRSDKPAELLGYFHLDKPSVFVGRAEGADTRPDIALDDVQVPRIKRGRHFELRNNAGRCELVVHGETGVQFYEKILKPSDEMRVRLGVCDYFSVPADRPIDAPCYKFMIVTVPIISTMYEPRPLIQINRAPNILVYSEIVKLSPKEYAIFEYLYQHRERACRYEELLQAAWTADERKQLHDPLSSLRQDLLGLSVKLRMRSHGSSLKEDKTAHCFLYRFDSTVQLCLNDAVDEFAQHVQSQSDVDPVNISSLISWSILK